MPAKCCRSNPRCRSCPARRIDHDRLLVAIGLEPGPRMPPHLSGVPASLHKYEPLLLKSWEERIVAAASAREEAAL